MKKNNLERISIKSEKIKSNSFLHRVEQKGVENQTTDYNDPKLLSEES